MGAGDDTPGHDRPTLTGSRGRNRDEQPTGASVAGEPAGGPEDPRSPSMQVLTFVVVAVGLGAVGLFTGFATMLGITATAVGDYDTDHLRAAGVVAASSAALGVALITSGALVWLAHRWARGVAAATIALVAVSSIGRIVVDDVSFLSVIGTTLSTAALVALTVLLVGAPVREHVARGRSARLR